MTVSPDVLKSFEQIKELPTVSKLRLAADLLERAERSGEGIDSAFKVARRVAELAVYELGGVV